MKDIIAVVLAAGKGTRMKSDLPKVLHPLLGMPMLQHLVDALRRAGVDDIIVVAGHGSDLVTKELGGIKVVIQKELLGSGNAVDAARKALGKYSGDVLIAYGDTPLIRDETVKGLIAEHKTSKACATLLTAELKDPTGYGRIVRGNDGEIIKIVEETEADLYEEVIEEINVGMYCFAAKDLFDALEAVKPENKKKEYFLTDTVGILHKAGKKIASASTRDTQEIIGVNTRVQLAEAGAILRKRILDGHMMNGVTIEDPHTTTIYPGVTIGRDTVIYPHTVIESDVTIGMNCRIGPFARLRGKVFLDDDVEIGNFVELVRTTVGKETKIKHHTYMGDTSIGKFVNVGAGTITANYDGKNKNKTIIDDGAFIGVGTILIAPVRVGKKAMTGAGCVVLKNNDIPAGATVVGIPAKILRRKKGEKR